MVRQKTISLDEKTAIIAGRIPNFSAWVRFHLMRHALEAYDLDERDAIPHIAPESARVWGPNNDLCNPRNVNGICLSCYPEGVDA